MASGGGEERDGIWHESLVFCFDLRAPLTSSWRTRTTSPSATRTRSSTRSPTPLDSTISGTQSSARSCRRSSSSRPSLRVSALETASKAHFAVVSVVTDRSSKRLELPSLLIGVLGTVLGFIVSYRTSSAAERYGEGRKLWASVVLASRTWARMVWIHVPNSFSVRADDVPVPEDEIVKAIIEKRTSMNLCAGFSVALKHYLRGEGGIYYKDLYPLMSFIPRYSLPTSLPANNDDRPDVPRSQNMRSTISSASTTNGFTTTPVLDSRPGVSRSSSSIKIKTVNLGYHQLVPSQPLLPSRNPPPSDLFAIASYIPFFSLAQELLLLVTRRYRRDKQKRSMRHRRLAGARVNENIPLEVTLLLSAYVAVLSKRKVIDATVINVRSISPRDDALTRSSRFSPQSRRSPTA